MHQRLNELVGTVQAKSRRDYILYSGAVVSQQVPLLLELLREVISNPLVRPDDIREMEAVVEYELEELKNKTDELISELVYGPAYYSSHRGSDGFLDYNSIFAVSRELKDLTVERVMEYWKQSYQTNKMMVVGAGLPHGQLYNIAHEVLGGIEKSEELEVDSSVTDLKYEGGWSYIEKGEMPLVYVAIAFEGASPTDYKKSLALAILHMLMGGGSSFSAGGPGKGMYSRLYTRVLNRHHWIDSCRAFSNFGRSTGLFGIQGSALPSHARELTETLLKQLYGMADALLPAELSRAKNQIKSSIVMGLESRMTELEDLAEQVSYLGKYRSPKELCEAVDAVDEEEIRSVALDLLVNSVPTVAAYGPLHRMPSYETVLKWHSTGINSRC